MATPRPPVPSAPAGWLLVGWTEGLRAPIPGVPVGTSSWDPVLTPFSPSSRLPEKETKVSL